MGNSRTSLNALIIPIVESILFRLGRIFVEERYIDRNGRQVGVTSGLFLGNLFRRHPNLVGPRTVADHTHITELLFSTFGHHAPVCKWDKSPKGENTAFLSTCQTEALA